MVYFLLFSWPELCMCHFSSFLYLHMILSVWNLFKIVTCGMDLKKNNLELNNSEKSNALLEDIGVGAARVAWFLSWRLPCSPYAPHTPPAALFLPAALAWVGAWSKGSTSARQVQQGRPDVGWATGVADSLDRWQFAWAASFIDSLHRWQYGWTATFIDSLHRWQFVWAASFIDSDWIRNKFCRWYNGWQSGWATSFIDCSNSSNCIISAAF